MRGQGFGSGMSGMSGMAGTVSTPVTLIEDAFTDANTTALASHTIAPTNTPATSWTLRDTAANDFTIQSNKARCGNGGVHSHSCNAGQANVTVSGTARRAGTCDAALVLRLQDASNYWIVDLQAAGAFKIFEKNATVYTERATAAVTFSLNTDYAVVAVASGTSISGTVDGANQISYSSSFLQSQTNHGIWGSAGVAGGDLVSWDTFTVTTP